MLISHRNRFIYTKTAKTGGTSVESYFEPCCLPDGEWVQSHARDEYISSTGIIGYRGPQLPPGCIWWNHMSASAIKEQIGADIWERYFKFCVIRNPYDKAVSSFYFFKKQNPTEFGRYIGNDPEQFEQWLMEAGPPVDRDKYLIEGQFCLNDVVRYENLHEELERICNRLNIAWEPSRLPSFKAGVRPRNITAQHLYTDKSREIVRSTYEFELDYFGYSFPSSK